jgi:hypothetical protein
MFKVDEKVVCSKTQIAILASSKLEGLTNPMSLYPHIRLGFLGLLKCNAL